MNTKRLVSVVMILGLMATNMAQAFADTIVSTPSDPITNSTTVQTKHELAKETREAAKKAEKAKKQAEKDAKKAEHAKKKEAKAAISAQDLVCMQTAVATRETAVVSSFDTYFTTLKTALTARMDDLKAAWALTDATARQEAIKKAWSDFDAAMKGDRETLKTAKKSVWDAFQTSKKTCHAANDAKDSKDDTNL